MRKPKYIFIIICLIFFFFISTNSPAKPIEERSVPVGIGCDIDHISKNVVNYIVSLCIYVFQENKTQIEFRTGVQYTVGGTREDRQMSSNEEFLLGSEKTYIFSERACRIGLHPIIDILYDNPEINDIGKVLVFQGNPDTLLKKNVSGYISSSDFLEGLIKNAYAYNFFSKKYNLMDVYEQIGSEGMSCSLPYVEIRNGGIDITGVALFNKDKMISKIDVKDARNMYMLKEPTSTGIISLYKSPSEYIDLNAIIKQKRSCKKIKNRYFFNIDLEITCNILSNEKYKNFSTDPKSQEKLKKDIQSLVTEQCNAFINKMKSEIKLDCLDLGRVAASKYGRNTGTDWNKTVCNSDINVNTKVIIDNLGRSDY